MVLGLEKIHGNKSEINKENVGAYDARSYYYNRIITIFVLNLIIIDIFVLKLIVAIFVLNLIIIIDIFALKLHPWKSMLFFIHCYYKNISCY